MAFLNQFRLFINGFVNTRAKLATAPYAILFSNEDHACCLHVWPSNLVTRKALKHPTLMHPCPDVPSTDTGSFLLRLANLVHAVLLAREAAQLWQLPMMEDCLLQSSGSLRVVTPPGMSVLIHCLHPPVPKILRFFWETLTLLEL